MKQRDDKIRHIQVQDVILFTSVKETKFTTYFFGHLNYCRVSHGPYFGYFETILHIQKRLVAEDDDFLIKVWSQIGNQNVFVGEIWANLETWRVLVATEVSYLVTILYTVNNVVQKIDVK